jgi:Ni,Fe-hydrogenase III large subunit
VHFAANVIGGVRIDIDGANHRKIFDAMEKLEERLEHYISVFKNDASVKNRTKHIGYLSKAKANELSPVGPNLRASGIDYDVRETGYLAYKDLKFRVVTGQGGDAQERCIVRLRECIESARMIRLSLSALSEIRGEIAIKLPPDLNIKPGKETVSRVEAPRGDLFYYVQAGGDRPYRVRIRTPTYQTFHVLEDILKGYSIPDVPVIIASLDPCFSCTDRMTIIDVRNKKERIVTKHEILHMRNGDTHHGGHHA